MESDDVASLIVQAMGLVVAFRQPNKIRMLLCVLLAFVCPYVTPVFLMISNPVVTRHSANVIESAKPLYVASVESIGREIKRIISNHTNYLGMKIEDVEPVIKKPGDPSKGSERLRWLIREGCMPAPSGRVVELGAGRGGWTKVICEECRPTSVSSVSLWNQPGQEKRMYYNEFVEYLPMDVRHFKPRPTDTFLWDLGENVSSFEDEIIREIELLRNVENWFIQSKPKNFAVRIPNPFSSNVVSMMNRWKDILGTGRIVRCPYERNSVLTVYFVPGVGNFEEDLSKLAGILLDRITRDKYKDSSIDRRTEGIKSYWPELSDLPVPKLMPLDLTRTIENHGTLRKPIGTTNFLKELGWYPSTFTGSKGTAKNPVVYSVIQGLVGVMSGFGLWRTTETTPQATWSTVLRKVDKAPVEHHKHYGRMYETYKAISFFLRNDRGGKMRRMTEDEMIASTNKDGAMGWQERGIASNIGEYLTMPAVWKRNVAEFKRNLLSGRPIKADYNSIGKRERKQNNSSRLIWFLCGTARIYEALVLGHMDTILKKLPYSVSGIPLYDYGDTIADIMKGDKAAVCDDVAGWDTRIGLGILSLESWFIQSLTEDQSLKKEIEMLYRLYGHPLVRITRPYKGMIQEVLYQLQGQVASGRRVTYAMNTITNMVVTMCRAAYSQGVPEDKMFDWALKKLRQGHSAEFGGKISGDDSAVIMSKENAAKFATIGSQFMNDTGLYRKNKAIDEPSDVIHHMDKIEFCSHQYVRIKFQGDHYKWMPIRSVTEIMAKASLMLNYSNDPNKNKAWARAQALNLLVNYFHIPTVRMTALAILSCTPSNISLSSEVKGWSLRNKPWIQEGNVVDIVNGCLFGASSTRPCKFRIRKITDLGYINAYERKRFDVNRTSLAYGKWKGSLQERVNKIREKGYQYQDWLPSREPEIQVY